MNKETGTGRTGQDGGCRPQSSTRIRTKETTPRPVNRGVVLLLSAVNADQVIGPAAQADLLGVLQGVQAVPGFDPVHQGGPVPYFFIIRGLSDCGAF